MTTARGDVFRVVRPTVTPVPVVVSIPHAGIRVPADVAATFAGPAITALPMTDWHVDRLYRFLPDMGITVLHALWSRFVVDLNRPPQAQPLYPGRFETGVVPLTTFTGETVFSSPPTPEEQRTRIADFHAPYHEALAGLLADCRERHGRAVLVDAHSVASAANRLHGRLEHEIYLGDRDGASCGPWLTETVANAFSAAGYTVSLNDPYKGGYITAHYGALAGVDALQIEMAQRIYMDEDHPDGAPGHPRFERVSGQLAVIFERLLDELPSAP